MTKTKKKPKQVIELKNNFSEQEKATLREAIGILWTTMDNIEELIPRVGLLIPELALFEPLHEIATTTESLSNILISMLQVLDPMEDVDGFGMFDFESYANEFDFEEIAKEMYTTSISQKGYLLDIESVQHHSLLVSIAAKRAWRSCIELALDEKSNVFVPVDMINFFYWMAVFYHQLGTKILSCLDEMSDVESDMEFEPELTGSIDVDDTPSIH